MYYGFYACHMFAVIKTFFIFEFKKVIQISQNLAIWIESAGQELNKILLTIIFKTCSGNMRFITQ